MPATTPQVSMPGMAGALARTASRNATFSGSCGRIEFNGEVTGVVPCICFIVLAPAAALAAAPFGFRKCWKKIVTAQVGWNTPQGHSAIRRSRQGLAMPVVPAITVECPLGILTYECLVCTTLCCRPAQQRGVTVDIHIAAAEDDADALALPAAAGMAAPRRSRGSRSARRRSSCARRRSASPRPAAASLAVRMSSTSRRMIAKV